MELRATTGHRLPEWRRGRLRPRLWLLLLLALALPACGRGLYDLPDPPPRDEWRRHSLDPAEDEARSHQAFLAAQGSVLAFLEAMRESRWEAAYEVLSNETRILLDDLSPNGRGETVLAEGRVVREGAEYRLDPVDLFVIADLDALLDEMPGEREQETYRRKEIWARSSAGDVRRLVLIYEDDAWRLHRPTIALTPGSPGRRALDR
jgi:hypothetical protein